MVILNAKIFTMEDETIECGFIRIKGKIIDTLGDMSDYRPNR